MPEKLEQARPKRKKQKQPKISNSGASQRTAGASPLILFGKRVAALLIDWLLATIVFGAVLWALFGTDFFRNADGTYQVSVPAICYAVYFLGAWIWQGTTPGLLLFGLNVVDVETKTTPQPWQWWVRGLGFIVAAAPLGLGFLWALWDREGRGWHDHISGTAVTVHIPSH